MSKDELIIEIEESPFGDTGAVYKGLLGMVNHFKLQLTSYRSPLKTKEESEYLERDIAGYDEILKSNSEENAQAFMKAKVNPPVKPRFSDNLAIVNYLKEKGLWK